MPCIDPTTRSPGVLFLTYIDNRSTEVHSIGWHFVVGIDIGILGPIRTEANRLAALVRDCLTPNFTLADWGVRTPTGHVQHQEPLTTTGAGRHTVNGNMQDYASTTMAFIGRGLGGPSGCSGKSISRLHIGGALDFAPGSKSYDLATDVPFNLLIVGLNASTFVPGDFYGQVATLSAVGKVQWNASTQRRYGS